jgi:hypothetical protein
MIDRFPFGFAPRTSKLLVPVMLLVVAGFFAACTAFTDDEDSADSEVSRRSTLKYEVAPCPGPGCK